MTESVKNPVYGNKKAALLPAKQRLALLKITDFDALAHLFQCFRQLLHQIHLDIEIDGKVGILMSGIDGFAHIEIDIRRLFKKHTADECCPIVTEAPFFV